MWPPNSLILLPSRDESMSLSLEFGLSDCLINRINHVNSWAQSLRNKQLSLPLFGRMLALGLGHHAVRKPKEHRVNLLPYRGQPHIVVSCQKKWRSPLSLIYSPFLDKNATYQDTAEMLLRCNSDFQVI